MKLFFQLCLLFIYFEEFLFQIGFEENILEIRLNYSTEFKQFIQSYKDDTFKKEFNGSRNMHLKRQQNYPDLKNKFIQNISQQKDQQEDDKPHPPQIFTDLSSHTLIEAYFGNSNQTQKVGFDLNQPYNWIKGPNFQYQYDQKDSKNLQHDNIILNQHNNINDNTKEAPNQIPFLLKKCEHVGESSYRVQIQNSSQEIQNKTAKFLKQSPCLITLNDSYYVNCKCMNYLIGNITKDFIQFQDGQKNISFEFYKIERQFTRNSLHFQDDLKDGMIGFPIEKSNMSIIQEYFKSNLIKKNSFSLYLYFEPTNLIQPCIVVGDINNSYFQGKFNYSKMYNFNGQYAFGFTNINIQGLSMDIENSFNQQRSKLIQHFNENRQNQIPSTTLQTENKNISIDQFIGVLSNKDLFTQLPLQAAKHFINSFRKFKIWCKKNKSNILECVKGNDAQFPNIDIQISGENNYNQDQYLHLKGENYVWECKKIRKNQNLKSYFQQDFQSIEKTKNSIQNYKICKTFFQVNEKDSFFTFGFSFMENFYIQFDIDNQVIGFSQISRISSWARIINHSKLTYIIGPLAILIVSLYYYLNFNKKQKQNQSISLTFNQLENKQSNLLTQV
ncbi:hypothetical protein ABPG74_004466 [Tetrahymena malaccensis]